MQFVCCIFLARRLPFSLKIMLKNILNKKPNKLVKVRGIRGWILEAEAPNHPFFMLNILGNRFESQHLYKKTSSIWKVNGLVFLILFSLTNVYNKNFKWSKKINKVWMVKKGGLAGNGVGRQIRVNDRRHAWTILMSPKYSKYIVPFYMDPRNSIFVSQSFKIQVQLLIVYEDFSICKTQ